MSAFKRAREMMARPLEREPPRAPRPNPWPAIAWLALALVSAIALAALTAWPIFFR